MHLAKLQQAGSSAPNHQHHLSQNTNIRATMSADPSAASAADIPRRGSLSQLASAYAQGATTTEGDKVEEEFDDPHTLRFRIQCIREGATTP